MVKRKTARQKVGKKEAKKAVIKEERAAPSIFQDEQSEKALGGSISGRLKRKQTKRMQFLSNLQKNQDSLQAKKVISKRKHKRKKSALNSLSTLAEFLPSADTKNMVPKADIFLKLQKSKNRQQIVVHEVQQLTKVLDHQEFKTNAFSAIHKHLLNTLGPIKKDTIKSLGKGKSGKKGHKKRQMGNSKCQNMEEM